MTSIKYIVFVLHVIFISNAFAFELDKEKIRAIDEAVAIEMKKQDVVGLAIGIVQDGKVAYTKGYGYADLVKKKKVNESTLFRWASVAKPMTAVAALQLVEKGELDLDEDIRSIVPEFPDKGVVITTRQLLSHLAGMPHYQDGIIKSNIEYKSSHPFEDVVIALDTFKETPLVSKPGEKYHYSTHGFILASAVIQKAGDKKFARQIEARIAKPLKMLSLEPDYQWKPRSRRAKGYRKINGKVVDSTDTDVSWKLGAGGWISNIGDLTRFAAGLIGDEILSAESKQLMWTSQLDGEGKRTGGGLGVGVGKTKFFNQEELVSKDTLRVTHNGFQEKTRTRMVIHPYEKHGVVVMSNSEYADPGAFTKLIYSILIPSK